MPRVLRHTPMALQGRQRPRPPPHAESQGSRDLRLRRAPHQLGQVRGALRTGLQGVPVQAAARIAAGQQKAHAQVGNVSSISKESIDDCYKHYWKK